LLNQRIKGLDLRTKTGDHPLLNSKEVELWPF
jgi:hypothetical protein